MGNHCSKQTDALLSPSVHSVRSFSDLESFRLDAAGVKVTREVAHSELSSVWLGSYLDQPVAVKRIATDAFDTPMLSREILTMSRLVHPRIVRFVGCTWTSHDDLSVVSEYMAGGDVLTFLETTNAGLSWECEKSSIAVDIASSLAYLHAQHPKVVCHDLKARNVLLSSDMVAKLSDIEVLLGESYSEQADVYSFGAVLAELDTRGIPHGDNTASRSIHSNGTQTDDAGDDASASAAVASMLADARVALQAQERAQM